MSVNKVILIGNVGKDPEIRTANGVKVTSFTLATSETYTPKDGGEKVTNTEWHNCVAWRNTAELIEKWVKKGSKLYVEGKLKTESYDKEGVKHYVTKVVVDQVQFLDKKEGANLPQSESQQSNEPEGSDLPF